MNATDFRRVFGERTTQTPMERKHETPGSLGISGVCVGCGGPRSSSRKVAETTTRHMKTKKSKNRNLVALRDIVDSDGQE
jgi:hypothetical protein